MQRTKVNNNVFIVARKNVKNNRLDYYMQLPDRQEIYMFTRNFSSVCYSLCKAGIQLNRMIAVKCRNSAVMNLVDYLKYFCPYFLKEYDLEAA